MQVAHAEASASSRSQQEGVQAGVGAMSLEQQRSEGGSSTPGGAGRYLADHLDALEAFAGVSGRPARLIQVRNDPKVERAWKINLEVCLEFSRISSITVFPSCNFSCMHRIDFGNALAIVTTQYSNARLCRHKTRSLQ